MLVLGNLLAAAMAVMPRDGLLLGKNVTEYGGNMAKVITKDYCFCYFNDIF
jgi:hypothetical protein